jgi:hypothetical protein
MLPVCYHEFKVTPRAEELGGGWNLHLLQDGRPVGGRVFELNGCRDAEQAYADAIKESQAWLETQSDAARWAAYLATLQKKNMP